MDSFSLVVKELEESRAKVKALEEEIAETSAKAGEPCNCSGSEVAELRSELEAAEARYQEEKILSTVETQCAYELMDQLKTESDLRHGKLAAALESAKSEVIFLKASLFDKESELKHALDANKKLQADTRPTTDCTNDELKQQLQGALEENGQLKLELQQYESAEKGATTRTTPEADAAEAAKKGEMETELRRLRVQAEQWRKAAETAMALLTVGKGANGKVVERTESWEGGKYAGLCEELDDDAAARKNGNVLRRISGMWKNVGTEDKVRESPAKMGKKGKWFSAVRKVFSSSDPDGKEVKAEKSDKTKSRRKWPFGKSKHSDPSTSTVSGTVPVTPTLPPPSTQPTQPHSHEIKDVRPVETVSRTSMPTLLRLHLLSQQKRLQSRPKLLLRLSVSQQSPHPLRKCLLVQGKNLQPSRFRQLSGVI
ncbi:hypothetical protein PR202_gb04307 [Eleusine coracana subsp. coracana]|uniref:Uncharacterized protein n=1 Tax=Eleusine coracana subsp. coracana TaxID=191504 RepID=A0AAV5E489_ELECO|nr:hypothetical protein PR202_gb04307 [Eleusine coracana subsp. coracana]